MEANQNRNRQRKPILYWNDGNTARVIYTDEQESRYESYGNTAQSAAPAYEPVPKKQPEKRPVQTPQQTPAKAPKPRPYARPRVDHNIGFLSMCVLLAAIAVTLYTCIMYLQVQSETVVITKEIRALETELENLKDRNEAAYNEVLDAVNLDLIYRIAVQDLGMVYPNQNSTIFYESAEEGYVRQFGSIPEADKLAILKDLLR